MRGFVSGVPIAGDGAQVSVIEVLGYGYIVNPDSGLKDFYAFKVEQVSPRQGEIIDYYPVHIHEIPDGVILIPFGGRTGTRINFSTFIKDKRDLLWLEKNWIEIDLRYRAQRKARQNFLEKIK